MGFFVLKKENKNGLGKKFKTQRRIIKSTQS